MVAFSSVELYLVGERVPPRCPARRDCVTAKSRGHHTYRAARPAAGMLRSEPMTLCQVVERNDAARALVVELGEAGLVQFRDLNGDLPQFQRAFADDVKRCDEIAKCGKSSAIGSG